MAPSPTPADAPAVPWLGSLFQDLGIRAPHGVTWSVNRPDPPLRVRVGVADGPRLLLSLRDFGPLARIALVEQIQLHIDAAWDIALPPCPEHGLGMQPVRESDDVSWRCPHGDAGAAIGAYDELLWPPRPEDEERAASLLGHRLHRRGVTGMDRWSVRGGVVRARLRQGGDEAAVRAAAAPLAIELAWSAPAGWSRRDTADGEVLSIANGFMRLAALQGPIRRSPTGGVLVGSTDVEFLFDHHVGTSESDVVLLDADRVPFAYEGDTVRCGGGFGPPSPVEGTPSIFSAGRITRLRPD